MNKRIFWSEEVEGGLKDEKFHGGYYFRAFDLIKFMKLIEKEEGEVVGLEFEGNNVNIIIRANDEI
jgi:hypothetical protein